MEYMQTYIIWTGIWTDILSAIRTDIQTDIRTDIQTYIHKYNENNYDRLRKELRIDIKDIEAETERHSTQFTQYTPSNIRTDAQRVIRQIGQTMDRRTNRQIGQTKDSQNER